MEPRIRSRPGRTADDVSGAKPNGQSTGKFSHKQNKSKRSIWPNIQCQGESVRGPESSEASAPMEPTIRGRPGRAVDDAGGAKPMVRSQGSSVTIQPKLRGRPGRALIAKEDQPAAGRPANAWPEVDQHCKRSWPAPRPTRAAFCTLQ